MVKGTLKYNAISKKDNRFIINVKKCRVCNTYDCTKFVLDGSMELVGKETDVSRILDEIIPYKNLINDYGVAISGGEPTCQFTFLIELLKAIKYNGFHTAIETNASSPKLLELLKYLDFVICDLKHIDDKKHREQTGFTNKMVLKNIKRIAERKHPIKISKYANMFVKYGIQGIKT